MNLPENKKINRDATQSIKIYVYGQPNIGKTTFANQFPDALMINTDGNYKYVNSPVITISGENAWVDFIDTIKELSKQNNTYRTIVVDLVEDIYQYCRAYYCKQWHIEHESDLGGYSKGYDIIRNAFLIALRTLANCNYNLVLISHEDSETIKSRTGKESTLIKPALTDKVSKKVQGMLEITGRITVELDENDNEVRILHLTSSSDQVGGNKIPSLNGVDKIELGYDNLLKAIGSVAPPIKLKSAVIETPKVETQMQSMIVSRKNKEEK